MKPYDQKAVCPKCNFKHITVKYKDKRWDKLTLEYDYCEPFLRRKCPNCSYKWEESTADYVPEEPNITIGDCLSDIPNSHPRDWQKRLL